MTGKPSNSSVGSHYHLKCALTDPRHCVKKLRNPLFRLNRIIMIGLYPILAFYLLLIQVFFPFDSNVTRACYDTFDKQDVETAIHSVENKAQQAAEKLYVDKGRLTQGFLLWQK